jgi:flagellar biosynthesis protein FliQ
MNQGGVISIVQRGLLMTATLAGPILLGCLVVGLVVSIFQSVTSIQEQTLSFVPKLMVVAAIIFFSGHWMLGELTSFTTSLYGQIPQLIAGS